MLCPKQLDIVGAIKKECFDCGEVDPTYINRSVVEKVQSSDEGFAAIEFEHFLCLFKRAASEWILNKYLVSSTTKRKNKRKEKNKAESGRTK